MDFDYPNFVVLVQLFRKMKNCTFILFRQLIKVANSMTL